MPDSGAAVDLTRPLDLHVVGVGGPGMSAIATVLVGMGHRVSGSDIKESPVLARMRAQGVTVHVGHRAENLAPGLDFVAVSTAIPDSNLEVAVASERGVPVLRRAEMLAAICATRSTVAVAGTHGKTTTSSMLALILIEAGMQPSFVIGADVNEIGTGAAWDDGDWLVVEADESDGTFLELPRQVAIVTNCEPDHLEYYGSVAALEEAFARFLAETPGSVLVCADDPVAARLGAEAGAQSYGTAESADWRMVDLHGSRTGTSFHLVHEGQELGQVRLPVAGAHNARNACAAMVTAALLGASFDAGQRALGRFAGVARRFEHRGESAGVTFIDDYAHLPTEVRAAVSAARDGDWRKVVTVFQPHRYSRTAALWDQFGDAFVDADTVVLTDVYPAGEQPRPGVSGKLLVQAVLDAHPWSRVVYLPRRGDLVGFLRHELQAGDLCLTLGAGDLTSLPDEVREQLAHRAGAGRGG